MYERRGELDPLLIAERQLLDLGLDTVGEPETLEDSPTRSLGRRHAHAVEAPEVHDLVERLHPRVQAPLLGHVAEASAGPGIDGPIAEANRPGVERRDP